MLVLSTTAYPEFLMAEKRPALFDLLREDALDPAEVRALKSLPLAGQTRVVNQIQAVIDNMVLPRLEKANPTEEHKEIWWIHSDRDEPWAGLRLATFIMNPRNPVLFLIHNDYGDRLGVRVWDDVSEREGWKKVERVPVPNRLV